MCVHADDVCMSADCVCAELSFDSPSGRFAFRPIAGGKYLSADGADLELVSNVGVSIMFLRMILLSCVCVAVFNLFSYSFFFLISFFFG